LVSFISGGFTNSLPNARLGVLIGSRLRICFRPGLLFCFFNHVLGGHFASACCRLLVADDILPIRDIQLTRSNIATSGAPTGDDANAAYFEETPRPILPRQEQVPAWAGHKSFFRSTTLGSRGNMAKYITYPIRLLSIICPEKSTTIFCDPEGFLSTIPQSQPLAGWGVFCRLAVGVRPS